MKNYNVKQKPFNIYGVFYDDLKQKFYRMDKDIANKISVNVNILASNTSGGRITFSTNSKLIGLKVKFPIKENLYHFSKLGTIGFILDEIKDNKNHFVHSFCPGNLNNIYEEETNDGFVVHANIKDNDMHQYVLYMPTYNDVSSIEIILDDDALLEEFKPYKEMLPILYYGSSITQGACSSRSDLAYPTIISKWNHIDYLNLGFSGSALGEDLMIDYLSKIKCSLFVMDYDYNARSVEELKNTHYKMYQRFRNNNPETPILLLSAIYLTGHNDLEERIKVIKDTYQKAKLNGDNNIYYLDGRTFFNDDKDLMTIEGLHPNDIGLYYMAKGIYLFIRKINVMFA